jgi:hypothetical protein
MFTRDEKLNPLAVSRMVILISYPQSIWIIARVYRSAYKRHMSYLINLKACSNPLFVHRSQMPDHKFNVVALKGDVCTCVLSQKATKILLLITCPNRRAILADTTISN